MPDRPEEAGREPGVSAGSASLDGIAGPKSGSRCRTVSRGPAYRRVTPCLDHRLRGILLDAELYGEMTDDRPPAAPVSALMDELDIHVKQITAPVCRPRAAALDDRAH